MMPSNGTFGAWARAAVLAAGLIALAADRAGAQFGYINAGYPAAPGFAYPDFVGFANTNEYGSITPLAAMMYGGPGGGGLGGMGGGTGWGNGYGTGYWGGGAGMYGMSPMNYAWDNYLGTQMMASRYNLMNAQASAAYQAANLYRQRAADDMMNQYRTAKYSSGYDPKTAKTFFHRRMGMRPASIPLNQLIGRNGEVLWPAATPTGAELGGLQQSADDAVRKAVDEYRKDHHASVASVVDAKDRVGEFGAKALDRIKKDNSDEAEGFQIFLSSLERALDQMGDAAPRTRAEHLTPDDAPRTGGDILKQQINKDSRSGDRANPPAAPTPTDTPKGDRSRRPS